ncbi:UNVERIFIED_ORG: hypothetical protein BCL66_11049 [Martelella mediterranea]
MTEIWPLRFREVAPASFLFTDDAGGYFNANSDFLDRYISDELTDADRSFLSSNGQAFEHDDDLSFTGFCARWAQRINKASKLDFVILVPTLRCNLSCDYCQVSRVSEHARGFDWSEEQLQAVCRLAALSFGSSALMAKICAWTYSSSRCRTALHSMPDGIRFSKSLSNNASHWLITCRFCA